MSAIWGIIDFNKNHTVNEEYKVIMKKAFNKCKIDKYFEMSNENYYFGSGVQFFTEESKQEVFPIVQDNNIFISDVMLDNRDELCNKLGIKNDINTPDGAIQAKYIRKYPKTCLNDMLGAYVYVDYDSVNNKASIVCDAVCNRFVNYMIIDNVLYFSSLLEPLREIMNGEKGEVKLNHRWLSDFIGQDNYNMFTECEETPYIGIYRLGPAQEITIDSNCNMKKNKYWDPFRNKKKLRLRNDEEYKDYFLNLYTKCINSLMRANGEMAMYLSGGFDSNSIAAIAAPILAKQGKKLYSFTSVPLKDYKYRSDEMIEDETDLVLKTLEVFDNIEPGFMDMPGVNPWYSRVDYVKITELPYKSFENLLWLYEGMKQASEKGAKIILKGAFGNGTVSYNNQIPYMSWLFSRLHWIEMYKEINALRDKYHYTRKSVLKTTVKSVLIKDKKETTYDDLFKNSFVYRDYLEKNGTSDKLIERNNKSYRYYTDIDYHKESFLEDATFRHYSEFEQRNSLYTGVITRDPTRDKRIIEFVCEVPHNQFTNRGVTRRLIREYMKDIVPNHILEEEKQGRQSADLKWRMCEEEKNIKKELLEIYGRNIDSNVIDCRRAIKELETLKFEDARDLDILRFCYTALFLEFVERK